MKISPERKRKGRRMSGNKSAAGSTRERGDGEARTWPDESHKRDKRWKETEGESVIGDQCKDAGES